MVVCEDRKRGDFHYSGRAEGYGYRFVNTWNCVR